jgi:hypothetical protein
MTDLATIRDCDRELDRIGREQAEAIRANAKWKLPYLKRRKKAVSDQRAEMQHGDFFRASPFDQMRAQCK